MTVAGDAGYVSTLDEIKSFTGLQFLQRIVDGSIGPPPITRTLGFRLSEVAPGFALFTMTPGYKHYNPLGSVHGGVASTLLDSCMSCAIQTNLDKGVGYITLELKVNLVRAMTDATGPVRAEGRSLYVGRRSATAEGKIIDGKGTLLAHGTTTCLVFPL
jgi:uncharacterized protein (TIGR00369 family)